MPSSQDDMQISVINNKFILESKKKLKQIEAIYSWTNAFVNFILIYFEKHPLREVEIFKF
jgi:hypothetical protein